VHEHGTIATAQFQLRNAGEAELLLTQFRTDCACKPLEVEADGRFIPLRELRLAGGEVATVRLRKSVRGVAGQPFHSTIVFRTNMPERPEAMVRVTVANVLAGVTASPAHWTLGTIPLGRLERREFTLSDSANPPRPVERVESSDPTRLQAALSPDGKLVVEVDTTRPGPVDGSVRLYVHGGKADPDPVLITGRVVAPVECSPASVRLPRRSSGGLLYSTTCLVRATGGQPLDLRPTELPDGVRVEVDAGTDAGPTRMVCVTATSHLPPGQRTVRLLATAGDRSGPVEIAVDVAAPEGP
jgi:hypothetical protein